MVETAPVEETQLCSSCDKQIEKTKMRLHDIQCARMTYRCHCGTAVAKSDKEHHESEMHTLSKCADCGHEDTKQKIVEHSASCNKKPRFCDYCENMIPEP